MSRDVPPDPDDPDRDSQKPRAGRLSTTGPGVVTGFALGGLVLGWLLGQALLQAVGTGPRVGWVPVLALFLAAAIVGAVARSTHSAVRRAAEHRGPPLEPHQAVNRLVLAKASAIAGALVAGGYAGYALSWAGRAAELARERVLQSLLAALGAALTVAAALLLERACRVRDDED